MSDLVERLRKGPEIDAEDGLEAADRIEELEQERDEWKAKFEWCCQKLKIAANP